MMRVLFVLEHFHPYVGGAETLFANLATALAASGHQVRVVTSRLPGTERFERWRDVEIIRVATPSPGRRYAFTLLALPAVLREARSADLIHTTTYNAALPAAVAAALRRIPGVITVHEVFGPQWNRLPGMNALVGYGYRAFEWLVLHLPFRRFICDSDFTRQRLRRLMGTPDERTRTVYPIFDHDFWSPLAHAKSNLRERLGVREQTLIYLYFGRPGVSKGVEFLVEAAEIVRRERPDSRLVMLMSEDPPKQYRRIVASIGRRNLTGHVVILPPVDRAALPGYLLAADCVVVPSLSEGFGYSAMEAAALGCRVIVTGGHASQEFLEEVAEFVPARDAAALARAILNVKQGVPAPIMTRRFDAADHVAGVLEAYREVLR
jgi:D-inositol-3-phosphate glycosyltransferase